MRNVAGVFPPKGRPFRLAGHSGCVSRSIGEGFLLRSRQFPTDRHGQPAGAGRHSPAWRKRGRHRRDSRPFTQAGSHHLPVRFDR